MKFKDFYEIPKFKTLDKTGKVIFVFSFVLPIAIVYTFLHLYFLPFGLDQNYTLESKEVSFTNRDFFYTIEGEEYLDGIAEIKVEPRLPKRNPFVTASVEGEGTYIVQHRILNEDIVFNPDFEREFEEDFEYEVIEDYEVKDEDILVFKIEYDVDWLQRKDNQLLLKYKNLRIIQHKNLVEFRLDDILDGDLKTFQTYFQFYSEDHDSPITLYAIYKKPNETNGFLELVAKHRISDRITIPSIEKEYDNKIETYEIQTVWHPELILDLSQNFISLKQEEYTKEFVTNIPIELKGILSTSNYYEQLFKPQELISETPNEEDRDYADNLLIAEEDFAYKEDDPNTRHQIFYKKDFFEDFQSNISKVSVGYEYPIIQKKELKILLPNRPIFLKIVGENSEIKDLRINLYREPVWKKF